MPIATENNRGQLQYQIFKAGESAGFVQYSMDGADMWVLHTSMTRQFKSALRVDMLIHHALADAYASRLAVLPFCPAVRTFTAEHREFTRLVPAEWQHRIPSPAQHKADGDAKVPLDFIRLTGSLCTGIWIRRRIRPTLRNTSAGKPVPSRSSSRARRCRPEKDNSPRARRD